MENSSVENFFSIILQDLITAVVALVADPDQSAGPHVGVADYTLAVTLLTQAACRVVWPLILCTI